MIMRPAGNDPLPQVAFFRNMNLGQARSNSPSSAVLVGAFTTAGAVWATNFQTNGTVIFAASAVTDVISGVRRLLRVATGYTDAVIVRSSPWVSDLAGRLNPGLPSGEVALFDAPATPLLMLPWTEAAGRLTILELDAAHAVTSWAATRVGSNANPTLTQMLGVPVTCRGVPTMIRLAVRLSR